MVSGYHLVPVIYVSVRGGGPRRDSAVTPRDCSPVRLLGQGNSDPCREESCCARLDHLNQVAASHPLGVIVSVAVKGRPQRQRRGVVTRSEEIVRAAYRTAEWNVLDLEACRNAFTEDGVFNHIANRGSYTGERLGDV